ncbi:hypothetical protein VAR608DRAFT_2601 [Variovorax sp. HW608]|uniref:hypothetical protein n=1 Tax=Variovorax sp. HW608 TaxID=1034889 RepID=UPI00081FA109|nr:hypothetical protein [Variovorax sp. HW608]SCK30637.1 hypothetical protein VAR608DRAFT_2601 [Variovorax sp. HW608]
MDAIALNRNIDGGATVRNIARIRFELGLMARRRLMLLREIARASNPSLGRELALERVLGLIREFFSATLCIMVSRDFRSSGYSLRIVKENEVESVSLPFDAGAAAVLVGLPDEHLVTYQQLHHDAKARCAAYDLRARAWVGLNVDGIQCLVDLLGASSFVSVPVHSTRATARIYVVSSGHAALRRSDAMFLNQIVALGFSSIGDAEAPGGVSSRAFAVQQRDISIQPYIGLQFGLGALRIKAGANNLLSEDLDCLIAMAASVIADALGEQPRLKAAAHEAMCLGS